jgi:hypothetical protein
MQFETVQPIDRPTALEAIRAGAPLDRSRALVSLAFHDPDLPFVEDLCLKLLDRDPDPSLQSTAALCLGHLARIHGQLHRARAISAIRAFAEANPSLAGRAQDAIDDIQMFAQDSP